MTNLSETTTTAVQSSDDISYCTECQGHGWTPRGPCDDTVRSRGPHQKCSEPSLTMEQQRVWQTVRDLPGVRIRATRGNNAWSCQQCVILSLCNFARPFYIAYIYFYTENIQRNKKSSLYHCHHLGWMTVFKHRACINDQLIYCLFVSIDY